MDQAEMKEFLELVRALWTLRGKKANPLKRLKVSKELLDFFFEKPMHLLITDSAHILEEAEKVNQAALEEIFGQRSAQVAAGAASSHVPPACSRGGPPIRRWKSDRPSDRLQGPTSPNPWSPASSSPTPALPLHVVARGRPGGWVIVCLCHVMGFVFLSCLFRFFAMFSLATLGSLKLPVCHKVTAKTKVGLNSRITWMKK